MEILTYSSFSNEQGSKLLTINSKIFCFGNIFIALKTVFSSMWNIIHSNNYVIMTKLKLRALGGNCRA